MIKRVSSINLFFDVKKLKVAQKNGKNIVYLILHLYCFNKVQVFVLIQWTFRLFEKKIDFWPHLDQILVIFGQKVNIRLFCQKQYFLIFYHSHKCFGNIWSISKFYTSTSHKYDKTSSVVYFCLMLKHVGYLPFAVRCLPSRNCLPDPTIK